MSETQFEVVCFECDLLLRGMIIVVVDLNIGPILETFAVTSANQLKLTTEVFV